MSKKNTTKPEKPVGTPAPKVNSSNPEFDKFMSQALQVQIFKPKK